MNNMSRIAILQWGKCRSVVMIIDSLFNVKDNIIMDNELILNLEENGNIIVTNIEHLVK